LTTLTVHNLDDELHDSLRDLANSHGRSVEDEAREILRGAVLAKRTGTPARGPGKLGSRIAARFAQVGLEQDIPELRGQLAVAPSLER